ncbi:hypothetical protein F4823DRAFT_449944 [Ustulina deusta]|nr:hypothetical protein F4823DRAFT_449944 [Ustulina deusta]
MPCQTRSMARGKEMPCQTIITTKRKRMPSQTRSRTRRKTTIEAVAGATTFNSLPTEIRLMIWEEFVRRPRIIHIDLYNIGVKSDRGFSCYFQSTTCYPRKKSEQVCPFLGVNHESRYVALKEPLIHLDIAFPVLPRKRFRPDYIRCLFAIRSHDIVFFDGVESWVFNHMWIHNHPTANNIANIMIDLDIHHINYRNPDATPCWQEMFTAGEFLVNTLGNTERLESFYCLTRGPIAREHGHFELDDLCGLAPGQFPGYKQNLKTWLKEFREFRGYPTIFENQFKAVKKAWKNVSVR